VINRESARRTSQASRWDYVMIVGNGGSGTKRLLRIFDQSRQTHCRNEPYNNRQSPFEHLRTVPRGWILRPDDLALMEESWDAAVEWTRERMGDRDWMPSPSKDHFHPTAERFGLPPLLSSRRIRSVLRLIAPALRREEWLLPRWAGNRAALRRALLVMKFNQSPGFARWVLLKRSRVKVIHIVRHPAACLHSWRKRHLAERSHKEVEQNNLRRLEAVAEFDPSWAPRLGDLRRLSAEESELLFWLYGTLTTHAAGLGRDPYERVLDEEIALHPVATARRLYAACGLTWTDHVEAWLEERAENWRSRTHPWQHHVSSRDHPLIERLLADGELRTWWKTDQSVSDIDYTWK
jgi:hypothetical protein